MTYKTAWRMVQKIKEAFQNNTFILVNKGGNNEVSAKDEKYFNGNLGRKHTQKAIGSSPAAKVSNRDIGNLYVNNGDGYIRQFSRKRDRTARLLKLQMLLSQSPLGLDIEEIADKCCVSDRTAYRDLRALESELSVPIWQNGNKHGISDGYFLPPINITLAEAAYLFLAARLTQNYFKYYDPNMASIFLKLNTITPVPFKNDIQRILEYMQSQPRNTRKVKNFNTLVIAWLTRHKVRVKTRPHNEEEYMDRIIEPYMIEPSVIGGSCYVIARCNLKGVIYAFKLEHIIGDAVMQPDTYEIPSDFDAIDFLDSAWGVQTDQKIQTIKLRFSPRIRRSIEEERVHSSQINEVQADGSIIMTIKVRDYIHIRYWIMRWGKEVEVIEPESLKNQIRDTAQSIVDIYSQPKQRYIKNPK
jgi:proteasome accessory factor B